MTAAIVDSYPLTPMQQGMLFHALSSPHSGVDIEQLVIELPENVDAARMRAAWDRVVARHGVLRTAFRWDGSEPMQCISASVDLPLECEELPPMSDSERSVRIDSFLQQDRQRGFAMDCAPLMRLRLFVQPASPESPVQGGHATLVWTFHHALLDGRSFPIVLEDVFSIYDEPSSTEQPSPREFREFVAWLRSRDPAQSMEFWRGRLSGFTAPTPLVVDEFGTMHSGSSSQADSETLLCPALTTELRTFAADIGVTLNTLVQGAWAILLSRYSREEAVCFGATRAGRAATIEGAGQMVGIFINTVPVRVRAPADALLVPWLRDLRQAWIDVRPHEHTPLTRVQSWSDIPRGSQLFQTLVVFENSDLATRFHSRGGVWAHRRLRLYEKTNFPVCLAAYAGESLRLVLEYDGSSVEAATIGRMLGHVRTLLRSMVAGREGAIGQLEMLPGDERSRLLAQSQPRALTESVHAGDLLHEIFAAQAARTPGAVALIQGDTRVTYGQLDSRADAVAAYLGANGAGPGSIVGLCMERTPELVIALLAILKSGAAYLPIDLAYPPERLAFMLEDASAPMLITQRSLENRLPQTRATRAIFLEEIPAENPLTPQVVRPDLGSDPLCYVLYTSGSTGKPKGCEITHRNVVRLFTATETWFHFGERDVWTLFHSTAFDFSVWEIWGALLHGGTLVVVPYEVSRSPEQFHDLLVRERVTVLNQTPSAFRQLISADLASANSNALSLRTVIFGGEALEMRSLIPWFERHGDEHPQLVNMYGITETTVHVTYRPLRACDTARGSVIGVPIPDLWLYILDPRGEPTPVGVPGELHVGGAGLARGYHQRPELTAARFIPDPFNQGERLYRTGDLARWLPDGDIEYLGRMDQQVKIRGFRIELGEIESILLTHPSISECVVLARDDEHGGKRLIAWYVSHPPSALVDHAGIRAHLKASLPDYMLPAAFVRLDRMPLTANGKLDARSLPEPPAEREGTGRFIPPGSVPERLIAEIWCRILKIERVGVHDNFFELGGDSILSILVVAQARRAGLELTPKLIFDKPTIAELAAASVPPTARLPERETVGDVPLTPIQRWFFSRGFSDGTHWNQAFAFHLNQNVSTHELDAAFARVTAAHPVFRMRFTRGETGWTQTFDATSGPAQFIRVDTIPALHRFTSLEPPLLHYLHDGNTLVVVIHHLIVDGVSWRILLEDLDAALRGTPLAQPTTGFHTWAHALAAVGESPRLEDESQHWRDVLAMPPTSLPLDASAAGETIKSSSVDKAQRNPDLNTEGSAETITLALDRAETSILLAGIPAKGHRVQDALLTALAHALTGWTKGPEHIIELEGHGREESALAELAGLEEIPDLSRTIGWFTTIFPYRLRTCESPAATLVETGRRTSEIPRNGFGWMLRSESLEPPTNGEDRVQFDTKREVLFNYLGQFDQTVAGLTHFKLGDTSSGSWRSPSLLRTHVLEINCLVIHGCFEARFTFSQNLHRRETIASVVETFGGVIRTLLGAARFPLARCDTAVALGRFPDLEDIYPLSPMQRLFLALELAQPGSGTDQWHLRLVGPLDVARLQAAWDAGISHHSALRAAYIIEGEPHSVIVRGSQPIWHTEDWSALNREAQQLRFDEFLKADAARPFDLAQAPHTRLALFRIGENEHRLVWTHHHLEMDGWSWPLLFRDVADAYARYANGAPNSADTEPQPQYRNFIEWLDKRPSDDAEFWRPYLSGFSAPTPLPFPHDTGACESEIAINIPSLADAARRAQVTENAIVQSAWAALLSHHASASDVIFGGAFSGRPAELQGVDRIVGHFVNNLPIRVRVSPEQAFVALAQDVHRTISGLTAHQFTSLQEIHAFSELPWNARIFSSLLIFQNYRSEGALRIGEARIEDLYSPVCTNYPLTLILNPGPELRLTLIVRPSVATEQSSRLLLEQLAQILRDCVATHDVTVSQLVGSLPRFEQPAAPLARAKTVVSSSEMERAVAEIWREAFSQDVSVTDNFFDVGGHSLLMLKLHARLCRRLGREIPVVKLFQYPTIRSLAQFLGGPAPVSKGIAAARDRAARARAAMGRNR